MSDSMSRDLKDLLANLNFFGNLPRGKKINISAQSYDDPDSKWDSLKRTLTFGVEAHGNTLDIIDHTLDTTKSLIKTHKDTKYHDVLLEHLMVFRNGVANIPYGYKDMPGVKARVAVFLTEIDLCFPKDDSKYKIKSLDSESMMPPEMIKLSDTPGISDTIEFSKEVDENDSDVDV